jgi:hypothetical protein
MQEPLSWFVAGAVVISVLRLTSRFARRHRDGIDVNDRGRLYQWAKEGEL